MKVVPARAMVAISQPNFGQNDMVAQPASTQWVEAAQTATSPTHAKATFASVNTMRPDSNPFRCERISAYSNRKLQVAIKPVENANPRVPQPSRKVNIQLNSRFKAHRQQAHQHGCLAPLQGIKSVHQDFERRVAGQARWHRNAMPPQLEPIPPR